MTQAIEAAGPVVAEAVAEAVAADPVAARLAPVGPLGADTVATSPVAIDPVATGTAADRAPVRRRDPALDLLRAVALARVILWHTFAAPWMTIFAAMPVMFFVAGTLLAASGEQHSYPDLVRRRLRRLLVPLWAYGAVVAGAAVVRAARAQEPMQLTPDALWKVATWVLPLTDPSRSSWHGGWLSDHLWYLRAYLWIVLLAPLFVFMARRLKMSLLVLGAALVAMEVAAEGSVPILHAGTARVLIGDFVTYGIFALLGMAYHARRRDLDRLALAAGALAAASGAGLYAVWHGLPDGNVNSSYPAVVLTGFAWLFAAGAAEGVIRRIGAARRVAPVSLAINRRAETIYLWHPAAILGAYVIVDRWVPVPDVTLGGRRPPVSGALVLVLAVVLTAVAVFMVGWVEDVGARRAIAPTRLRLGQGRLALGGVAGAVALAVAVPLVAVPVAGDTLRGSRRSIPPPPSYREALSNADFAAGAHTLRIIDNPDTPVTLPADDLQRALVRWQADHPTVTSLAVGIGKRGMTWTGEAAKAGTAKPMHVDDNYAVASLTKSFTMALVLQQAQAGKINLDAPMPVLPGLPQPPKGVVITPRELLEHTSGLVDYSMATGFDEHRLLTPETAVATTLRTKLVGPPGTVAHYSSTNYLYLGLLLEKVTGRTYESLLDDLTSSLGLAATRLDKTAVPGRVGFSAAGVHSTVADMNAWASALFEPGRVVSPQYVQQMRTIGAANVGLGTWPLCPCSTDVDGTKRAVALGQYVGDGGMYVFADGMTLLVHLDPAGPDNGPLLVSLGDALSRTLPTG